MVTNRPANAGDTGSVPSLGGFNMPRGDSARGQHLLSLCPGGREPQLLSPYAADA